MNRSKSPKAARVLMTVDAVGGVWRYAMDLAAALDPLGFTFVFAGLGPQPSARQIQEASKLGTLRWIDEPLDWMVQRESELAGVAPRLGQLCRQEHVDLVHLNLPSQADGLVTERPVAAMSHSCVATWFAGVRRQDLPQDWRWHKALNRRGFDRADIALAPSHSHAAMLQHAYGQIRGLHVVYNSSRTAPAAKSKDDFVLAAGRWWDDGKNGGVLDEAAKEIIWPVIMAGANNGPNGQHLMIRHAKHLGEQAHQDILSLMRRAAIFVSPSICEPFGLAPLEAARSHAALVLADIPTYHELWRDAAIFADPTDSTAIAAAVNQLVEDPQLRAELVLKAAERSRRFDPGSQARAMADLYSGLLQRDPTRSAAE